MRRPVTFAMALVLSVSMVALLPSAAGARTPEGAPPEEGRVQQARQAAAVGDVEKAERIYTEILSEDPENERALWGLVGLYSSAGMEQEKLIPLLERRLSERPDDTQAKMELGRAHAKLGDHELAHELWMEVLGSRTADVGGYTDIGFLEIRHRMFEQALETFMMGRSAFRSKALFSQELTQVHTALGDYDSTIDECVLTVNQHGGAVAWATNFIELMLDEGAGGGDVRTRMAEIARDEDATVQELGLAGSVFLALDDPERALATFLRADEVSGREGTELLGYAEILVDDGRAEQAREAYLMIVERHHGTSNAARAGTAAAELLAEAGDPVGAVAELRAVADVFDGLSWGAQALFEAARVELDVLGDAEAALATTAELRGRFGERARRMNAELTMIEVDACMKQRRFDEAYERASDLARGEVPRDILDSALFAKGFISFLAHDYAKATGEFRELVKTDSASGLVNDAIRLMLVIANAQDAGDEEPVRLLAEAHAARLAGDMGLSEELLLDLADGAADEAVRNEALLLLAAMAMKSGDARRAVSRYDRIIDGSEAITARAVAMMRKADILWLTMGRTSEAADQYLAILEDLPANVLSGEARRKLDSLRRGEGVEG